jgi:hypothetical protein
MTNSIKLKIFAWWTARKWQNEILKDMHIQYKEWLFLNDKYNTPENSKEFCKIYNGEQNDQK